MTVTTQPKSKAKASKPTRAPEAEESEGKRRKRRRIQHVTAGVFGVAVGILGTWIRGRASTSHVAAASSASSAGAN